MQKANALLLLHPLFIGSLAVLLLNDFYGKYAYPGMFTGKLSDFAGLIVLPIFCRVLFPRTSKQMLCLAVALFFAWFKSPLSQPVIDGINLFFPWPLHRVVDYSDLVALSVLPMAMHITPKAIRWKDTTLVCLRWALGSVAFFSLCSTSVYRGMFQAHPAMEEVYFGESFTLKQPAADLLQNLAAKRISYHLDSVMFYPITNQHDLFYKIPSGNDTTTAWQPVSMKQDSILYLRREGSPFYLIPEYRTEERTFRNVRFTLSENRKKTKTTLTIQTFGAEGLRGYVAWDKKMKKEYKTIFTTLFSAQ